MSSCIRPRRPVVADAVERIPDPVVDAVEVQREQVDFVGEAVAGYEPVDIVPSDPRLGDCRRIPGGVRTGFVELFPYGDIFIVAIEEKPTPATVDDEVGGIALDPIASADLNRRLRFLAPAMRRGTRGCRPRHFVSTS